ncbi:MAG: phosphoribosylamine--glycine ligase [Patescibacteria group bacterium]
MTKQKILIIGSGGREHAIGWKIKQSARCGELFFAPGNAGTLALGTNMDIKATDILGLIEFVKSQKIDVTLAIPDDPLAHGIVDAFRAVGLRIFGPMKEAAQLESSKAYAKYFMETHNLPTAKFKTCTSFPEAEEYVREQTFPLVIKASGLALGKGVLICHDMTEALEALDSILVKKIFGDAGSVVVIEEFMTGPEVSIHAFSDGITSQLFPASQDHKRIGDGDTGPNTGGMGTIAPLPFVRQEWMEKIKKDIVEPTIEGMKTINAPFEGVLYPGLMLTAEGPKILEYNARFGDPETQTYMRLLETDLIDIVDACIDKKLHEIEIVWKNRSACTVICASEGYPGVYEKGKVIAGIQDAESHDDIVVFHAGTIMHEGELVTNGGRVLGVSAIGVTLHQALDKAYKAIEMISFDGMQYRKDIGQKALQQKLLI